MKKMDFESEHDTNVELTAEQYVNLKTKVTIMAHTAEDFGATFSKYKGINSEGFMITSGQAKQILFLWSTSQVINTSIEKMVDQMVREIESHSLIHGL